jgi:hypothetical protein
VPKETIAVVLFMGVGFGLLWGGVSVALWTLDERIPPMLVAPLWLTAIVAAPLSVNPLLVGLLVSIGLGLAPAFAFLALARLRGW